MDFSLSPEHEMTSGFNRKQELSANRIGEESEGFKITMAGFDHGLCEDRPLRCEPPAYDEKEWQG